MQAWLSFLWHTVASLLSCVIPSQSVDWDESRDDLPWVTRIPMSPLSWRVLSWDTRDFDSDGVWTNQSLGYISTVTQVTQNTDHYLSEFCKYSSSSVEPKRHYGDMKDMLNCQKPPVSTVNYYKPVDTKLRSFSQTCGHSISLTCETANSQKWCTWMFWFNLRKSTEIQLFWLIMPWSHKYCNIAVTWCDILDLSGWILWGGMESRGHNRPLFSVLVAFPPWGQALCQPASCPSDCTSLSSGLSDRLWQGTAAQLLLALSLLLSTPLVRPSIAGLSRLRLYLLRHSPGGTLSSFSPKGLLRLPSWWLVLLIPIQMNGDLGERTRIRELRVFFSGPWRRDPLPATLTRWRSIELACIYHFLLRTAARVSLGFFKNSQCKS